MTRLIKFNFAPRLPHCAHISEWLHANKIYFEWIKNDVDIDRSFIVGVWIPEPHATIAAIRWANELVVDGETCESDYSNYTPV